MKHSSLTVALSLAALFGGGLLLPAAASAHETNGNKRMHNDHHAPHGAPQQQRPSQHAGDWYLQRHREVSHHGYTPQTHLYRVHYKGQQPHHYQHPGQHHEQHHTSHQEQRPAQHHRVYAPVRLEIGYEIVL